MIAGESIGALQLVQKFLGRAFRRVEVESLFEIATRGVGYGDDKGFRLRDERERFQQLLLRANVRRHRRHDRDVRPPLLPPTPGPNREPQNDKRCGQPPKPLPAVGNFYRRLDIADVVRVRGDE